jgi:hypothetical protein
MEFVSYGQFFNAFGEKIKIFRQAVFLRRGRQESFKLLAGVWYIFAWLLNVVKVTKVTNCGPKCHDHDNLRPKTSTLSRIKKL